MAPVCLALESGEVGASRGSSTLRRMKRLLVTGPLASLAEFAAAARAAGWEALVRPLLDIEPVEVGLVPLLARRYDAVCVTSASAVPFLERALPEAPAWRSLPLFAVGASTTRALLALGLSVVGQPARGAAELAARVLALRPLPTRVLWPRGDRSEELAVLLRTRGVPVDAPIVYATRERHDPEPLPACDAVLFASPSAVAAWRDQEPGASASSSAVAIALGATTAAALGAATAPSFRARISLPEPTPAALERALLGLGDVA